MKGMRKRVASVLMAAFVAMALGGVAYAQDAENDGFEFGEVGRKTASATAVPGQYEITVSTPGAISSEQYSEIIVMVDASSSQGANLNKLKAMLVDLGEEVLHNDGSVRLTLMGFGMGPARVGSFYNVETLEAYLADITQDDLRQGVSATNCEAALDFVLEYIQNSGEKLGKTCVVFTSDGNTNMDETLVVLSTWDEHPEWWAKGASAAVIAGVAAGSQADLLVSGGKITSATASIFPDEAAALEIARAKYGVGSDEFMAAVDDFYNTVIAANDSHAAYVDAVFADALTNSGMTYADDHEGYSTSELEKAFLDYENGAFSYALYNAIHRMKEVEFYPDWYNLGTWGARAAASADKLANHEKVTELYMVDFNTSKPDWMDPNSTMANHVTSENITYLTSGNVSGALDKIGALASEFFTTIYKDTTVVDPMSKWVNLIPESIRIYDGDQLIYEYGKGWLYEDKQPAKEPITLTKREDGKYAITWRIKDGNLLYADRYSLKYRVTVDEEAEGFQYDTLYPANDPTYVEWTDAKGDTQSSEVTVPEVQMPTQPDDFSKGDLGFKIYKSNLADGAPISDIVFDIYVVEPGKDGTVSSKPTAEELAVYAKDANLVGTITTDSAGYAAFNLTDAGYGKGIYLIVERANDKVVAPADPFYVRVPMWDEDSQTKLDVVKIFPKNEVITEEEPPIDPDIPEEPEDDDLGQITLYKYAEGDTSDALKGAEFQVYRLATQEEEPVLTTMLAGEEVGLVPHMNGEAPVLLESDKDGYATSGDLPHGLYFLVETKAPFGFNLLEEPVAAYVTDTSVDVTNAVKIANTPGFSLPSTGGMGTTLMYVLGGVLVLGAGIALVVKRRAKNAE